MQLQYMQSGDTKLFTIWNCITIPTPQELPINFQAELLVAEATRVITEEIISSWKLSEIIKLSGKVSRVVKLTTTRNNFDDLICESN